jgi:hypothetical protein
MATLTPYEVAVAIVDCAYAAVDHDPPLAINRKGVVPGEIAWDDCQCGQLVISENRRYGSRNFPLEEIDHSAECGEPWIVVEYTLSLTRCVPSPTANAKSPAIADLQSAAQQLSEDMTKTRRAVMCCLTALYEEMGTGSKIEAFELGQQDTVGPEGGCGGHELLIFVGWNQDCGC